MIQTIVVEDDFRIADIHEEFLKKIEDIHVIGKAMTGKDAIQLVQKHHVDLVVLDLYLPDYLGTELIQKMREIQPAIDVIVITAATEKQLLETSLRSGIFSYLIKPLSMERFTQVLYDYKQQKAVLEDVPYVDQDVLDALFSVKTAKKEDAALLPKGIDKITLRNIKACMEKSESLKWTAEEIGQQIGSSRTTARRYLEYLVSIDYAEVEQEYGIIGRPERKYYRK